MADEFVAYLLELLHAFGPVRARAMFGGYGLYREGLMFGLVADDMLYLKVDDQSRTEFIAQGLTPFVYHKQGKPYSMSYYLAPLEALEDAELMRQWAQKGYAAALRSRTKKNRPDSTASGLRLVIDNKPVHCRRSI
ncbi:MAG: TfoX/Sxy family protein [Candidatus Competibacteraceae bacterium]|nr:TfoX/Sxy family protein [Candidatus Competibacteraceae bacterium]